MTDLDEIEARLKELQKADASHTRSVTDKRIGARRYLSAIERLKNARIDLSDKMLAHGPSLISRLRAVEAERDALRALVKVMLTEDPNDTISDGGHTVLDMWRNDARSALKEGE